LFVRPVKLIKQGKKGQKGNVGIKHWRRRFTRASTNLITADVVPKTNDQEKKGLKVEQWKCKLNQGYKRNGGSVAPRLDDVMRVGETVLVVSTP